VLMEYTVYIYHTCMGWLLFLYTIYYNVISSLDSVLYFLIQLQVCIGDFNIAMATAVD